MFALTANTSADIQYTITITHMFELSELKAKKLAELQEIAKELGIKKITALKKIELTYRIIDHQSTLPEEGELEAVIVLPTVSSPLLWVAAFTGTARPLLCWP